jgi:Uma2 family endonuclease
MSTGTAERLVTPEELLAMPDGDSYELVDGRLVERHMGSWSSYVGSRLHLLLGGYCFEHALGWVWAADASYQCFPGHPNLVRKPDVSFIRAGRLPGERPPEGHTRIPPDLAVEVISPKDLAYEISERVEGYLGASVRLVWVVDPSVRTVLIYRSNGTIAGLRERDELDGEDVVPGFRCPVRELFRPPVPPPQTKGSAEPPA